MRCILLLALASALTPDQVATTRAVMKYRNVPGWSAIIDSVLFNEIAFTDQMAQKVYIDGSKLANAPNTFTNVMIHECGHLLGAQHGDGSLGMAYAVNLDVLGNVVNDAYLLADIFNSPALSPAPQPFPWP
jgi:hypothetical protein